MSTREQTLAIVLLGLVLLVVGGAGGYMLIYEPIQEKNAAADQLEADVAKLDGELAGIRKNLPRLAQVKRQSLPPDEDLARREYAEMMAGLLRQANVPPGFSVTPVTTRAGSDSRSIPTVTGKKPAYTKVVTEIKFRKADMWSVVDFLKGYYSLNVLHQITHFSIKREEESGGVGAARNQNTSNRNDLSVDITSEAIILDGAEKRRTLLPVPEAFAAAGGIGGYGAILVNPEIGRGLTPIQLTPVLSTRHRDYSLIVLRDLFHGTLPKPASLKIDRIADKTVEMGQEIEPVKIPFQGENLGNITFTARSDSDLFPEESLRFNKLDDKSQSLTLVPAEGESGTATITVEAKADNGETAKAEFRVIIKESTQAAAKPDIAMVIRLTIAGTRSDGTAFATIRDNANRLVYEVEATRRRVKVSKFWWPGDTRRQDKTYENPEELIISDDTSSTNRRFKIVSVDTDGLVLIDLAGNAAKAEPKNFGKGPPRKLGPPRIKEGPADPLAGVVGAAGAAAQPKTPALYRWILGKTLSALVPVPQDEARKILERAAINGPVGPTAAAIGTPGEGN